MNHLNLGHINGDKLLTVLIIVTTYLTCLGNAESNANVDKNPSIDETKSRDSTRLKRAIYDNNYQDYSVWSGWSAWSTCSRTCGGGASFRSRHCTSKVPSEYMSNMPPVCMGSSHEYRACNIKECPKGSKDFRATQCSVFNNLDPVVIWIPLQSYGCELLCQTLDGLYMLNFGQAIDGTECLTENNEKGMCVSASCVKVGCDGVLNSGIEEDACGICGGWNHTCGHIKETFREEFPASGFYTYNSIATIPSGATNIRITDFSNLNYLSLRDEFDEYILNGNWIIEWPGEYHRAGASINYERFRNGTEIIWSPGPTNRDVQILLIFRERNPGIEYEYWSYPQRKPSRYQSGELIDAKNQIAGRHEFPVFTTYSPPTTTTEATTTIKPTTVRIPPPPMKPYHPDPVKPNHDDPTNNDINVGTKPGRENKERCGKCQKVRGRVEHYCSSDFVLQVEILSKQKEGRNELSYDVEIISAYKNTMHLNHREFLWVPNRCNCPKLKPGRQYLVTGNKQYFENLGESKLVVDRHNLVNSWKRKLHDRWDKIQADSLLLCDSQTRTE